MGLNQIVEMVIEIQADTMDPKGQRNVIEGEAELMVGFDFNLKAKLQNTIYAPYTAQIDRVAGTLEVIMLSFVPTNMVTAPSGSTHFKLETSGAEIDLENETFSIDS